MHLGRIVQVGRYDQLYERPSNVFVASFLGVPPMNLFRGRVTPAGFRVGRLTLPLPPGRGRRWPTDRDLVLGIRPENIVVDPAGEVRGLVETVHPLLAERQRLVYVNLAGRSCAVKTGLEVVVHPDEVIGLRFPPEHLHLFDGHTEARLN